MENFQNFQNETEKNEQLSKCFDGKTDLNDAANRWITILNSIIKSCFKKIRLGKTPKNSELENLFKHKEKILTNLNLSGKENLAEVEKLKSDLEETLEKIASICSIKNRKIVNEYLGKSKDTIEGFSQIKTYNLKKRLCPKNSMEPPSAKRNSDGELVSDPEELENLYLETYIKRLAPNEVPQKVCCSNRDYKLQVK